MTTSKLDKELQALKKMANFDRVPDASLSHTDDHSWGGIDTSSSTSNLTIGNDVTYAERIIAAMAETRWSSGAGRRCAAWENKIDYNKLESSLFKVPARAGSPEYTGGWGSTEEGSYYKRTISDLYNTNPYASPEQQEAPVESAFRAEPCPECGDIVQLEPGERYRRHYGKDFYYVHTLIGGQKVKLKTRAPCPGSGEVFE